MAQSIGYDWRTPVELPEAPPSAALIETAEALEKPSSPPPELESEADSSVEPAVFDCPVGFSWTPRSKHPNGDQEPSPKADAAPLPIVESAAPFTPFDTPTGVAMRVAPALAPPEDHRELDIARLVDQHARLEIPARLPTRNTPRAPEKLHVVIDRAPHLLPYRYDVALALEGLSAQYPTTRWSWSAAGAWRLGGAAHPSGPSPDEGALVVLGDLGALKRGRRDWAVWRRLGERFCAAGRRPCVLFPGASDLLPPEIRRVWRVIPWERSVRPAPADPNAALEDLLGLCAGVFQLHQALLRRLRRILHLGPEYESWAWTDPSMEADSLTAVQMSAAARFRYRELLAKSPLAEKTGQAILECEAGSRSEFRWLAVVDLPEAACAQLPPWAFEQAEAYFEQFRAQRAQGAPGWSGDGVEDWLAFAAHRTTSAARAQSTAFDAMAREALQHSGTLLNGLQVTSGAAGLLAMPAEAAQTQSFVALLPAEAPEINVLALPSKPDWVPVWASDYGEDDWGYWTEFIYQGVAQRCRWIPAGRFLMGSHEGEAERLNSEGPRQEITFTEGFWLFDTAVTQGLYEAVMDANPSRFKGSDRPVEQVSWEDVQAFMDRLSEAMPDLHLSLPSESAWEYACRAGSQTPFEPNVAHRHEGRTIAAEEVNYGANLPPYGDGVRGEYRAKTVPVKYEAFRPNAWGLWQMHGNVDEWCSEEWMGTLEGVPTDGSPRQVSKQNSGVRYRVVRGGSWDNFARYCRSAYRSRYGQDARVDDAGFRCVLRLGPSGRQAVGPEDRGRSVVSAGRVELSGFFENREAISKGDRPADRQIGPPPEAASLRGLRSGDREARFFSSARVLAQGGSESLRLPESGPFMLRTDLAELEIKQITRSDLPWASALGRDRWGLWANLTVDGVVQRCRWMPPGRFLMGSPAEEEGRLDWEGPQQEIIHEAGFWLFDTPVTQALYEAVMEINPSRFISPDRPVERVSWDDAQAFLERLDGKARGLNAMLPSESMWEYACRAGTTTATYAGPMEIRGESDAPILESIAWYGGNSGVDFDLTEGEDSSGWEEKSHPHTKAGTRLVKGKDANPWGLYDMLGNVWEWCEDEWTDTLADIPADGSPRQVSKQEDGVRFRVLRGGSWISYAGLCRSASRYNDWQDGRDYNSGFRCALRLGP